MSERREKFELFKKQLADAFTVGIDDEENGELEYQEWYVEEPDGATGDAGLVVKFVTEVEGEDGGVTLEKFIQWDAFDEAAHSVIDGNDVWDIESLSGDEIRVKIYPQ